MLLKNWFWGAFLTALVIGACTKPPLENSGLDVSSERHATRSDCRDEDERLSISKLCPDAAFKHLEIAIGSEPILPSGCDWKVQETGFAGDLLLYLAARCDGVTSHMTYSAGARQARLYLSTSAIGADVSGTTPFVTVLGNNPRAPLNNLERFARDQIGNSSETARCEARPVFWAGWPEDAFIFDHPDTPVSDDSPRAACGPYGFAASSLQYWRVFQGFSWFFHLGQGVYQDIDPRSLTVLTKADDGGWIYFQPNFDLADGGNSKPVFINPERFYTRDRDACAAAKGTYENAGLLGFFRCTFSYADAGDVCSDGRDCEGRCLAGNDAQFDPTDEANVQTGICQSNDNPFGCHSDVVEGRVQPPLCID